MKTCCNEDPEPFEGESDPTEQSKVCADPNALDSSPSEGAPLKSCLIDAKPATEDEGLTLLARLGRRLYRFSGSGFIQIRKGKAFLVQSIPLTASKFWHKWSSQDGTAVRLDPEPAPFLAVVGPDGHVHKLAGPIERDAILYWTSETGNWEVRKISDLPICVQNQLPTAEQLQLVGFDPIGVTGDPEAQRKLKALMGHGIVYIEKTPTAFSPDPSCSHTAEDAFTYVTKVLPFPVVAQSEQETGRHYLVFSSEGLSWQPLGSSETP